MGRRPEARGPSSISDANVMLIEITSHLCLKPPKQVVQLLAARPGVCMQHAAWPYNSVCATLHTRHWSHCGRHKRTRSHCTSCLCALMPSPQIAQMPERRRGDWRHAAMHATHNPVVQLGVQFYHSSTLTQRATTRRNTKRIAHRKRGRLTSPSACAVAQSPRFASALALPASHQPGPAPTSPKCCI